MRILAVDDHEEALRPLAKYLEGENFDVCLAFDGGSAIRTALAFQPQVVLLDIRMPAVSGIDIAKLLRQLPRFDSVVLIAITGHDDPDTRDQMEEAGITHVFRKPCDYQQLVTLLRTLCKTDQQAHPSAPSVRIPGHQAGGAS